MSQGPHGMSAFLARRSMDDSAPEKKYPKAALNEAVAEFHTVRKQKQAKSFLTRIIKVFKRYL